MKKLQNKAMMLFVTCLLSTPAIFAQGNGDNCYDVPLDGGITLLAAAGVGYGIKKMIENRKKNQEIQK